MSTYPDRCVLKIERRTIPGEDVSNEIPGAKITLDRPPSEIAADHPLVRAVSKAAGHPAEIGVAYWMDMALMNAAGIPTVALGPSGEGEHADEEWVDVDSAQACVETYAQVAQSLCG